MNRYAALGLVLDAHQGKHVIVLSESQPAVRAALDECARSPFAELAEVRRHNGAERLLFVSGGWIRFQSVRSSLRGSSADVVFIDGEADRQLGSPERDHLYCNIQLVTQLSRDDDPVIRA